MFRSKIFFCSKLYFRFTTAQQRPFITNVYKCSDSWNARLNSDLIAKVNLDDLYNLIDQQNNSKGVISAIDVDIFANAIKDASYLGELRDLLHKLRLSADTGSTLDSTHHATIRNYIEFDKLQELTEILADPLNYGIFLDHFSANILLDKLIKEESFERAARVSCIYMLQEDYSNEITNALCLYSCFKYLTIHQSLPKQVQDTKGPEEEFKIRIKYLRNPYFDDHFDIEDKILLSGKTLAWIGETGRENLDLNMQLLGWFFYKKFDRLQQLTDSLVSQNSVKIYPEVLNLVKDNLASELNVESVLDKLSKLPKCETPLQNDLRNRIENAINHTQNLDVESQIKLYKQWETTRIVKLQEQTERLERAHKLMKMKEKQAALAVEEQKLWFFENKEQLELEIESKKKKQRDQTQVKSKESDENYIPPEV